MDEKMQDILARVRETVAVVGNTAADAAYEISAKAMDCLTAGRRNVRLAELESSVLTELRHVGSLIFSISADSIVFFRNIVNKIQHPTGCCILKL